MSLLNQPEDLDQYVPKDNEVKLLRAKYDTTTGNFLSLENSFITAIQKIIARYFTAFTS